MSKSVELLFLLLVDKETLLADKFSISLSAK